MTDHSPLQPPEWICKRDGRLVPFDADKICRSLFAVTESLGRSDSFTARELTDGILHFLPAEADDDPLTTSRVAELVEKIVRELGQPALAQIYAAGSRAKSQRSASVPVAVMEVEPREATERALHEVFARELVSAHEDGLLTLTGLEAPQELAGWLLDPPPPGRFSETVEQARQRAGVYLAIDSPEHLLARSEPAISPIDFVRDLAAGLHGGELQAVVNLHSAAAPSWAGELADGPLFAGQRAPASAEFLSTAEEELLEHLLTAEPLQGRLRVDWHIGERDLREPTTRLTHLLRRSVDGAALAFAFDRPRRSVPLASGIDRRHPAVLLTVGLHLPKLFEQLERRQPATGAHCDADMFLEKLSSLARMALSAGVQKRDHLRKRNRTWPTFLVERARLVVAPIGLGAVVCRLLGVEPGGSGEALELARRIVQTLAESLERDARAVHLEVCLDTTCVSNSASAGADDAVGVTLWEPGLPLKRQLRGLARLHTAVGRGTATLLVPNDPEPALEELAELLHWTWQQTEIVRLRLVRVSAATR